MQQNIKSVTTHPINHLNSTNAPYNTTFIASFILTIPFIFLLGIIGFRKYRARLRRRQVAILEKIWLVNIKGSTFRQD